MVEIWWSRELRKKDKNINFLSIENQCSSIKNLKSLALKIVLKTKSILRILNCSFIRYSLHDRFQAVSCVQCHSRLQRNLAFQKQDE